MRGGLSIGLSGLYVGALLHQEAQTVQLVVSGGMMGSQVAIVVRQSDVAVPLYQQNHRLKSWQRQRLTGDK